jgi:YegS/Rv2252/BmrU family lipid kinase
VKRALVVINPISGTGRARPGGSAEVDLARGVLSDAGFDTTVVVTTGPGHATEAARREQTVGLDLAVAWGGDGTMNDVARVLAFTGVGLAIVPAGSGNGLARDLGVPMDPRSALAVAVNGTRRRIDVGDANGEYFFNVAGLGLDARIARAFAARRGRRGRLGYVLAGIAEVWRCRADSYELAWDGQTLSTRALFIALANSRQYGSHGTIAPTARLDDGRLDLVVAADQSLWSLLSHVPAFFRGTLRPSAHVRMNTFAQATIVAGSHVDLHLDGEPRPLSGPLHVRVHRQALDVFGPPADSGVTPP